MPPWKGVEQFIGGLAEGFLVGEGFVARLLGWMNGCMDEWMNGWRLEVEGGTDGSNDVTCS